MDRLNRFGEAEASMLEKSDIDMGLRLPYTRTSKANNIL